MVFIILVGLIAILMPHLCNSQLIACLRCKKSVRERQTPSELRLPIVPSHRCANTSDQRDANKREYTLDQVAQNCRSKLTIKYAVHWCTFTPDDDTVEPPEHKRDILSRIVRRKASAAIQRDSNNLKQRQHRQKLQTYLTALVTPHLLRTHVRTYRKESACAIRTDTS